jgi:hypothetical protein
VGEVYRQYGEVSPLWGKFIANMGEVIVWYNTLSQKSSKKYEKIKICTTLELIVSFEKHKILL